MPTSALKKQDHAMAWQAYPFIAMWMALVAFGVVHLVRYSNNSIPTSAPKQWPNTTALHPGANDTLVIFLHPRCSCSRASVRQLAEIYQAARPEVTILAAFFCPKDKPAAWAHAELWSSVEKIPGARLVIDRDGQEAARFGVRASGHVLLFDSSGELAFSGGITSSRGHDGKNAGSHSVQQWLKGNSVPLNQTPVFGCEIVSSKFNGEPQNG